MIGIYLLIGICAAILSALPLGASNIAVINTTLKENAKQAFKIATTAGIAEVLLSYYALNCNQSIKDFFNTNLWVQSTIVLILFSVGGYLFFKKHSQKKPKRSKIAQSKYATGFLLGIVNPPVLVYWVIAFGVINNNNIMLSLQSSFSVLFLFFFGVYVGKLITLYAYSKMSSIIKHKVRNISTIINKVTGVLLMCIGGIQALQLYFV
jgi:threonine/homoserine/homoserine lactone efflux protein